LFSLLQQEWQRTCPCPQDTFQPLEDLIAHTFIPALFGLPSNHSCLPPRPITALPIKKAGLALNNPTIDAPLNYNASKEITSEIVWALVHPTLVPDPALVPLVPDPALVPLPQPPDPRPLKEHLALTNGRVNAQRAKATSNQAVYEEYHNSFYGQPNNLPNGRTLQRRLARCCSTGAWLTARPDTLERTDLSAQEWHDGVFLRYGMTPPGLPATCDGCNLPNSTNHALNCPFGGLIILHHLSRNHLCYILQG
jgi:hypothetical protein